MKTSLKIFFAKWLERPIFQDSAASPTVYSIALRKLKSLSIFPGVLLLNANHYQPTPTPSALPLRYLEGISAWETRIQKELALNTAYSANTRTGIHVCLHSNERLQVGYRTVSQSVEICRRMKHRSVCSQLQKKLMSCLLMCWTRPWGCSSGRADAQEDKAIGALSASKHPRIHEKVGYALTRENRWLLSIQIFSSPSPVRSLCLHRLHTSE